MLAKIRTRYAEIQLRIAEKFDNPSMGAEIRVLAEKLNPDSWVNLEEAVNGIERFESEAESILNVLGRRRPT
jgi:predicted RNA-binding protein (virulence factor B family)